MSNNENWHELPTLQSVARAQAEGWEIEESVNTGWRPWVGDLWRQWSNYRGRPAQPKTRTVTSAEVEPRIISMPCWRHKTYSSLAWFDQDSASLSDEWQRCPCGDRTVEIDE
jgi:hypothetical protein